MSYPPHLLDALGRVYAKVALDRLIKDEMAMRPELKDHAKQSSIPPTVDAAGEVNIDGPAGDESSDNLK